MTSRQVKIHDTHFRIMHILQKTPDLTQRELAEKLGTNVGGLNYCFNALIDKGFVKMQNLRQSKNKYGYIYLFTPQGIVEKALLTKRFLKGKIAQYDAMKLEIDILTSDINSTSTPPAAKKA